jgi:hypothetical protein
MQTKRDKIATMILFYAMLVYGIVILLNSLI